MAGSWEMLKQFPHILIVSEGEEKVGLINDEHLQAVSESQVLLDKGKTLSGAIRRSFEQQSVLPSPQGGQWPYWEW